MLEVLAQTYSTYDPTVTTDSSAGAAGALAGFALFGGFFLFIWLAVAVVAIVAMWKIFEKAGQPGWKAIVPIYNLWTMCEIVGRPGWWALSIFASIIPFIGWILPFAVSIIVVLELGSAFGKDMGWSILLLVIFSLVGMLILGFGDDKFDKTKLGAIAIGYEGGSGSGSAKKSSKEK